MKSFLIGVASMLLLLSMLPSCAGNLPTLSLTLEAVWGCHRYAG
jgi:hypothetical protein